MYNINSAAGCVFTKWTEWGVQHPDTETEHH